MSSPHARRWLILACSATKADEPNGTVAIELYDGPAYRVFRSYERDMIADFGGTAKAPDPPRVLILSAEHGLIGRYRHVLPYDRCMDIERVAHFIDGPMPDVHEHTRRHRKDGEAFDRYRPASEVFVFGGELYRRVIQAWEAADLFRGSPVRYTSGGIGEQLGQLKDWLRRPAEQREAA